jgi:hypothetical protein
MENNENISNNTPSQIPTDIVKPTIFQELKRQVKQIVSSKNFPIISIALLLTLVILFSSQWSRMQLMRGQAALSGVILSVQPATNTIIPGQSLPVNVYIDTKGVAVSGIDLIINYDPTFLSLVSMNAGSNNFFQVSGVSGSPDVLGQPDISTAGMAKMSIGIGPTNQGKSGVGSIATLTFTGHTKTGQTTITIGSDTFIGAITNSETNALSIINPASVTINQTSTTPTIPIPTPTVSPTNSPNQSPTPSHTPTRIPTLTPTPSHTPTSPPTRTPTPTKTPTPTPTSIHTLTPTPSITAQPSPIITPYPSDIDAIPPFVQITSTKSWHLWFWRSNITISAKASDSSGIAKIELSVDGSLVKTCLLSTECRVSKRLKPGTHILSATAYDHSPQQNSDTATTNNTVRY